MESKKYIHYGHVRFDRSLFREIRNLMCFSKPIGGLWGSPVDAEFGWKEWCDRENFRACSENNSFTFSLKDGAKVAHIYKVSDLENLPKQDNEVFNHTMWCNPDFEKMLADGWDAVELHLSEEDMMGVDWGESLYWELYGWDCDSILIMNPDVVVEEV